LSSSREYKLYTVKIFGSNFWVSRVYEVPKKLGRRNPNLKTLGYDDPNF